MGTIVHKVMECLALESEAIQHDATTFVDDSLGTFDIGQDVAHLNDLSFDHYVSKSENEFTESDRETCLEWCYKALEYLNGKYDPRNRKIVAAEKRFDIEIDRPWADYKFDYNGQNIEGRLCLKGTIDLVTEVSPDTLEIIDWKTGKRLNWATGEVKTYKKLRDDLQLRLYHYAANKLFPQYKNVLVSIFFINDGGIFTVAFSKHDLGIFEQRLKEKYDKIISCQDPKLSISWKCKRLCHFGKNLYPGTKQTICEYIKNQTNKNGIDFVTLNYTDANHQIDKYNAPGE